MVVVRVPALQGLHLGASCVLVPARAAPTARSERLAPQQPWDTATPRRSAPAGAWKACHARAGVQVPPLPLLGRARQVSPPTVPSATGVHPGHLPWHTRDRPPSPAGGPTVSNPAGLATWSQDTGYLHTWHGQEGAEGHAQPGLGGPLPCPHPSLHGTSFPSPMVCRPMGTGQVPEAMSSPLEESCAASTRCSGQRRGPLSPFRKSCHR